MDVLLTQIIKEYLHFIRFSFGWRKFFNVINISFFSFGLNDQLHCTEEICIEEFENAVLIFSRRSYNILLFYSDFT